MKRIALISKARTGSHFLKSLMPKESVHATDEPFWNGYFKHGYFQFWRDRIEEDGKWLLHGQERQLYADYLEDYFRRFPGKHLFFDMKVEQMNCFLRLKQSIKIQFDGFVLLSRKNLLKMVISQMVMHERSKQNIPANSGDVPELTRVKVEPRRLLNRIRNAQQEFEEYDKFFSSSKKPCYRITYEDLLASPQNTVQQMLDFFSISGQPERVSSLKKQNPNPISEIVTNYDELTRTLKRNGLRSLLKLPE